MDWGEYARVVRPYFSDQGTVHDEDIPFRGLTLWQALDQWCQEHGIEDHYHMDEQDREEFELAYYGPRYEG